MDLPENFTLAYVDEITPRQFEYFVAEMLKSRGYGVKVTPPSGDFGVDVVATRKKERCAVQAKKYSNTVPYGAVQEAVAGGLAYNCTSIMVVTNNYYTPHTRRYVRKIKVPCELVDRDKLKTWIEDYHLAKSTDQRNRFRLVWRKHKTLYTVAASVALLVVLFLVFSDPLCDILC